MADNGKTRGAFASKLGFVLAAAGSAVGLGNVWRFPYVTGENGGGAFVIVYLVCIALVGLPIMIAEILIGRAAQKSPVGAFKHLSAPRSPWQGVGWLGVAAAFVILSFYSVVAGWALHYTWLSGSGEFAGRAVEEVKGTFDTVSADAGLNLGWHAAFMLVTMAVVVGGVHRGIERAAKILMPTLAVMMVWLLVEATGQPGFGRAIDFVFGAHTDKLTPGGVLEALGHSFFTLSLGMGAMVTYGSYLSRRENVVAVSVTVSVLDTLIALLACMILFPITFSFGMKETEGPGLVFQNMAIAFAQMDGGGFLGTIFFGLIVFAALTSSISLLEVAASYFIDERGWTRRKAVLVTGVAIAVLGVPSALSGSVALFGDDLADVSGRNWFDWFAYVSSNWLLPLGGLGIAVFAAWRVADRVREQEYTGGGPVGRFYKGWLLLLKWVVPVAVVLVFLHAIQMI